MRKLTYFHNLTQFQKLVSTSQEGFLSILAIFLLGATALTFIATFYQAFLKPINDQTRRDRLHSASSTMQQYIQTIILDDQAWKDTINYALQPTLLCLDKWVSPSPPSCFSSLQCVSSPCAFYLLNMGGNAASNVVAGGTPPLSLGFNTSGIPCQTFDPVNGNDGCPLAYLLQWTPICPPGASSSCGSSQIQAQISGTLLYSPKTPYPFNSSRYDFVLIR